MSKHQTEVRPATLGDLCEFYGRDHISPSTKAMVGLLDGKLVAIWGLAYEQGVVSAFFNIKDEARPFKHHIHRNAMRFMREARERHKYIHAQAEKGEPTAPKWLARLGFKNIGGDLWRASN